MQNNTFSFSRLGLLLRRDLTTGGRASWITPLSVFLVFYLITIINLRVDFDSGNLKVLLWQFTPSLMISGFIFSSIAFLELGNSSKKQAYLSIPATTLEKWGSKWLITALIFPIAFLLCYQVYAQLCYWTVLSMLGVHLVTFPLFDPLIWKMIGIYVLAQSVFFLSSASMPRFSLVKMIAIFFGLILLIMLAVNIGFFISHPEFGIYNFDYVNGPRWQTRYSYQPSQSTEDFLNEQAPTILWFTGYLLFLPLVLFISYLKLSEKEV